MVRVFQSAGGAFRDWNTRCLDSVQAWCAVHDFSYQFLGDELFDRVPQPLRDKLEGRTPILADLARLTLLRDHLAAKGGVAIWLDADTLIHDQKWVPDFSQVASFGEEYWLDRLDNGTIRVFRQPHNAFMMFREDNPILPFLHHVAHSMIRRVDSHAIAPQMVGPKLLKALHSLASFHLHPEAGALSPGLARELLLGAGPMIDRYRDAMRPKTRLWNLCGSLSDQGQYDEHLRALTENPALFNVLDP